MLLGSPPDTVHEFSLRKTKTSTPHTLGSFAIDLSETEHHPCYSGLQVQGAADSPASTEIYCNFLLYFIHNDKIVTNFANVFSLYTVPFFMSSMHLFFFLSLSQLPKKVFHHDPAFFFQYTCYFFYLMIKPLFFQYI